MEIPWDRQGQATWVRLLEKTEGMVPRDLASGRMGEGGALGQGSEPSFRGGGPLKASGPAPWQNGPAYPPISEKVSQRSGSPVSRPRRNQNILCSEEPWVNESGVTCPVACR